jgi:hypothetical protein
MHNILFYGNCQPNAILSILNLCKEKYISTYIFCSDTNISESTFLNYIINSDIIITQPINDNYREKCYLSTSFIIKNAKQTTKIILFDSCYFNFYYFDLTYKTINNNLLRNPIDYHYDMMIECFKNNKIANVYINDYVNNYNLKSSEELEIIANKSLHELNERYKIIKEKYDTNNIYIISIYEFVKLKYKEKLLFYSMNHPTKYVFQYICEEIVKYLDIPNTIDYNLDPLDNPRCILYSCIQKNVNFDISACKPNIKNLTNTRSITDLYYSTYKELNVKF